MSRADAPGSYVALSGGVGGAKLAARAGAAAAASG